MFNILLGSLFDEDLTGSFSQCLYCIIGERLIASFDKIMIESSVGIFWRTDGHIGEVQVVDGVGGDRGGNRILLPLLVRLADESSSADKPKADNKSP